MHPDSQPWSPARPAHRPQQSNGIALGLGLILDTPPWMDDSPCGQTDPEAFFPDKGGSTKAAKQVCLSCPVRTECLEYALDHDERFGIWGGLSERERRKLKKQRAAA